MARREYSDTSGGPPPDASSEAIVDLAQCALARLADRVADTDTSDAYVEGFCSVLMSGDKRAAERLLHATAHRRAGYAQVADGLLTAAARRLGEKWEQDQASFLEVSMAVSLIFRLNHDHAQRYVPIVREPGLRQAVFATLPGQAHNLGLVLAAEAFRQSDWQVTLMLDSPGGRVLDRIRRIRPDAVGLSASNLDRRHQITHLIGDLQAVPFRFRILVGGTAARDVVDALVDRHNVEAVTDIGTTLASLDDATRI